MGRHEPGIPCVTFLAIQVGTGRYCAVSGTVVTRCAHTDVPFCSHPGRVQPPRSVHGRIPRRRGVSVTVAPLHVLRCSPSRCGLPTRLPPRLLFLPARHTLDAVFCTVLVPPSPLAGASHAVPPVARFDEALHSWLFPVQDFTVATDLEAATVTRPPVGMVVSLVVIEPVCRARELVADLAAAEAFTSASRTSVEEALYAVETITDATDHFAGDAIARLATRWAEQDPFALCTGWRLVVNDVLVEGTIGSQGMTCACEAHSAFKPQL